MEITEIAIAVSGGFLAGCMNTLAGFGSVITLGIMMELLGMPGNLANGTNRVNILTSASTGSYVFYRSGLLEFQKSKMPIVFISLGALAGVFLAINVSNEIFKQVFDYILVIILIILLVNPKKFIQQRQSPSMVSWWILIPIYFALGIYAGFIQMGMGVVFLVVMVTMANYSLMAANALKVFIVSLYTILILAVFHLNGLVDWKIGTILAVGQTTGAFVTARLGSKWKNANLWAYRFLIIIVVLVIIRNFGLFDYISG